MVVLGDKWMVKGARGLTEVILIFSVCISGFRKPRESPSGVDNYSMDTLDTNSGRSLVASGWLMSSAAAVIGPCNSYAPPTFFYHHAYSILSSRDAGGLTTGSQEQTHVDAMLVKCWAAVCGAGSACKQFYMNQ